MAYRRRRRFSSSRRPRRRYTWVRQQASPFGVFSDTSVLACDLLWTARQPPGTVAKLDAPQPQAAPDTKLLPTLSLEDVMIERIRGDFTSTWTTGTNTNIRGAWILGVTTDSNTILGEKFNTYSMNDFELVDPSSMPAAVTVSWMYYEYAPFYSPLYTTGEIGTGTRLHHVRFDVKSRRRLRDWGDSLVFAAAPTGLQDATGTSASLATSVLLSHR